MDAKVVQLDPGLLMGRTEEEVTEVITKAVEATAKELGPAATKAAMLSLRDCVPQAVAA